MEDEKVDLGGVGLLGELAVEIQLVQQAWHPVRLDTARMASNADLLAIDRKRRVSIQVKTTNAVKRHSHSDFLHFGYPTNYLTDRENNSIFNSKKSPLVADVVIAVSYRLGKCRFVIMPVAFAEMLCRRHCDYWKSINTKKGERTNNFPIYVNFVGNRKAHEDHHEEMKRNLTNYEDAWHILGEPVERLHDTKCWPLIA